MERLVPLQRVRIHIFQVCDFLVPIPADALPGRGHVGDGVGTSWGSPARSRRPDTTFLLDLESPGITI